MDYGVAAQGRKIIMMVMIDTNIIISAVLNPSGRAAEALAKAMSKPFEPVVCSYILDELHRKFQEKFPSKILELEAFLYHMLRAVLIVPTPKANSRNKISPDNKRSGLYEFIAYITRFSFSQANNRKKARPLQP